MANIDHLQLLFEELGPATSEVAEVIQHDDNSWSVVLTDDTIVGFDPMADQDKVMMSTELGSPPNDRRHDCHQFLLVYNFNWPASGGIKMGLDAPEGNVVMMFEINTSSLTLQTLQQLISNFARSACAWRELISQGIGSNAPEDEVDESTAMVIRV